MGVRKSITAVSFSERPEGSIYEQETSGVDAIYRISLVFDLLKLYSEKEKLTVAYVIEDNRFRSTRHNRSSNPSVSEV